jgi:hypothetical protein
MIKSMNDTIQQASDLKLLRERSRAVEIVLTLPELEDTENEAWQARLRRRARACGCDAGALVGLLALVALIGWGSARWFLQGELPGILQGVAALAGVFIATGVGKALGLAFAEYGWRQDLAELGRLVKGRYPAT